VVVVTRPSSASLIADLFDNQPEDENKRTTSSSKKKTTKASKKADNDDELAGMFDDEAEEVEGNGEEEEDEAEAEDREEREARYDGEGDGEAIGGEHDVMDLAATDYNYDEEEAEEQGARKPVVPAVRPYHVVRIPPMKAQPAFQPNCGQSIEAKRYLGTSTPPFQLQHSMND
jgi:hypothetical protein